MDAKATIATAQHMGVKVKMVTGDALAIADETAKALGMGTNILDAATLRGAKSGDSATALKTIESADGYAQVFPEDKFHIVDVLEKHNHIVGCLLYTSPSSGGRNEKSDELLHAPSRREGHQRTAPLSLSLIHISDTGMWML